MNRYALRDDQWERIKDLLPGKPGDVGVTAHDNRRFVEAVLYRYRTGIPWRDLPERFGDWKNTHRRFSRWAKKRVWQRLFEHLAAEPDNEYPKCLNWVHTYARARRRSSMQARP
jgi:transposase